MAAAVMSMLGGVLVLAGPPSTAGTFPGQDGLIAYARFGDIYVMTPEGENPLGSGPLVEDAAEPSWSPNGRKLAFIREVEGEWEILVVRADGSGETQVTPDDEYNASAPTWLSNRDLVYTHRDVDFDADTATDSHMMIIRDSGSATPRVYRTPEPDMPLSLASPQGNALGRIAFIESYLQGDTREGRTYLNGIWVGVGEGAAQLVSTHGVAAHSPVWHPSGSEVAYVRRVVQQQCCDQNIYISQLGGRPEPLLNRTMGSDAYQLSFSPTGDRLVFSGYFRDSTLRVVDVRTGEETAIGFGTQPDWQPRPGSKQNFVLGAEVWAEDPQRPKAKPNKLVVKALAGAGEKVRVVMGGKVVAGGEKFPLRAGRADLGAGKLALFKSKVKKRSDRRQVVKALKQYRKAVAALEANPGDPALQAAVEEAVVLAKLKVRLRDSDGLTVVRTRTVQLV